jgi:spore coat polysaccharide biosynthesis predicted glycosyltransferase SpsG
LTKPTIILATSNGVGMGHLARATAVARALGDRATPIIFSMASGVAEIPESLGVRAEYVPGRDRGLMDRQVWDKYLAERLRALVIESGARIVTFDGVVPYPGFFQLKRWMPDVSLVWIRRGHWQKKPQRFVLGLQARLMDYIIEPGDYSRSADTGPTSIRNDAILFSPVSLFRSHQQKSRSEAARLLGLDPKKPTVLVQLGTGDADLNARLTAALQGLSKWKGVQIVLTKNPTLADGTSLVPEGMKYSLIQYFPLADVLSAFDGAIAAAGYNSVHEFLAAKIPTLLIANNRGTDNQRARALWCAENGYCLYAQQEDLNEIEREASRLADSQMRKVLSAKCSTLPDPSGANEIADALLALSEPSYDNLLTNRLLHQGLMAQTALSRGLVMTVKVIIMWALRRFALGYRTLFPHAKPLFSHRDVNVIYSRSTSAKELRALIKSPQLFEHMYSDSSEEYEAKRKKIVSLVKKIAAISSLSYLMLSDFSELLLAGAQFFDLN